MRKVVVGMSGGVDSSVAAWVLKKEGYQVTGITLKVCPDFPQAGDSPEADAGKVAEILGIEHGVTDCRKEFKREVIDYFARTYEAGRTPNPCTVCNAQVKWQALLREADKRGAQYVATGHYSRVVRGENGRLSLLVNREKDQTYALYRLSQAQLARTIMPLGGRNKDQVRHMAREAGLPVADKADSQDICFIRDGDYGSYLREHYGIVGTPGNFVNKNGDIIGRHRGIIHYTVGQRKGLGLSLPAPGFVIGIDAKKNEVMVGDREDSLSCTICAANVNDMLETAPEPGYVYTGKIRYNHRGGRCLLEKKEDNTLACTFLTPVQGAAPGQSLVIYREGMVCCGGIISHIFHRK